MKRVWIQTSVVIGSVIFAFLLLEFVARVFDLDRKFFRRAAADGTDLRIFVARNVKSGEEVPYIGNNPGIVRYIYPDNPRSYFDNDSSLRIHINSRGFRGREFQERKQPGTFRIVFLGDSFTLGQGVRDQDIYPNKAIVMARSLLEDRSIEVEGINLAVAGYNSYDTWVLWCLVARSLNPDMVILGYTLNDAEAPLYELGPDWRTNGYTRRPRPLDHFEGAVDWDRGMHFSKIVSILRKTLYIQRLSRRTKDYYLNLYGPENGEWLQKNLESIKYLSNDCMESSIPFLVLINPVFFRLDKEYPFEGVHRRLRMHFETAGISYVDMLPRFRGLKAPDLWVHPGDHHPNEEAHAVIAEEVYRWIASRLLVGERKGQTESDSRPGKGNPAAHASRTGRAALQ